MEIDKNCIEEIYKSHELITDVFVMSEELKFCISLFHNEESITQTLIKLIFEYDGLLLPIKRKGNIVKIEVFILIEKFRRKGICKSIHEKEMQVYKNYNIQQMQLKATYSGFFAWNKLGFSCCNDDEQRAKGIVIAYLTQNIVGLSEKSFNQESFSSLSNKIENSDDFLEWAEESDIQPIILMYKDI